MVREKSTIETNTIHVRSEQSSNAVNVISVVHYYNLCKTQVEIATTQVGIATNQANIALAQANIATVKAGEASTLATASYTWAEGSDEEVEALGGTHSSKYWADYLVNNAPETTIIQTETGARITTKDLTHGEVSVELYNGEKGDTGSYDEGNAIGIENQMISVKYDNSTIKLNDSNQLYFNNTADYQTSSQVNSAISTHNSSSSAHSDIRSAITSKEDKSNKVTLISSSSTNNQYPSAKCVYDIVGDIENVLIALRGNI